MTSTTICGMLGDQRVVQLCEFLGAPRDEHEIGAAAGELGREFLTDPAAGTCDQRRFVVEFHPVLLR